MDCYDGCGAPLVDGVCEHCGRTYPTEPLITFNVNGIIEDALESEEEEEIVAVLYPDSMLEEEEEWDQSSKEWHDKAYGPSYEPDLMQRDLWYPAEFEDGQKTLGMATGAFLLIGALLGFISPPLALPFLGIGLLAAITGGIRQLRHKEEE